MERILDHAVGPERASECPRPRRVDAIAVKTQTSAVSAELAAEFTAS